MAVKPPDADGIRLFWWAAHHLPRDPTTSFSGKSVLITGANSGLGLEAAVKFAALGAARLILCIRSLQRGEEAKTEICRRTDYDSKNVHLYEVNMDTFESVKGLAEVLSAKEPRIDIAVLNAGVTAPSYVLSPDGYEMTLQVNVLSTALLAILLLPLLRRSSNVSGESSCLEFVGSDGHRMVKPGTFSFGSESKILDTVNSQEFFNYMTHYQVSKLLLMYVIDGIVKSRSQPTQNPSLDVIITTVCPGLCRTNLGRGFSASAKAVNGIFQSIFARTAEEGSRSIVSGAALGHDAHGQFWVHDFFFR
jgi:NAD(P)-dependent dehydrogenase (short-subunit alcohol dehydrogenase family)